MRFLKFTILLPIILFTTILLFMFLTPGGNYSDNVYNKTQLFEYNKLTSKGAVTKEDVNKVVADLSGITGTSGQSTTNELACPFGDIIVSQAKSQGIDPLLVASIISQESDFQEKPAGDPDDYNGLMQVGQSAIDEVHESYSNIFDPETNIRIGTKYFALMLKTFNNDVANSCGGYNWGPGYMQQYINGKKSNMPNETKNYIRQVPARYEAYKSGALKVGDKGNF